MRKIKKILLLMCLSVIFSGCGNTETVKKVTRTTDNVSYKETDTKKVIDKKSAEKGTNADNDSDKKTKILIAYFTRADNIKVDPDVDAKSSASINLKGSSYEGNLKIMADYIKDTTGGDTFSILTTEYYPTKYSDTTDIAKEEQNKSIRPKISNHIDNIEEYDYIFLGYPVWWGGLPMPVYTFLEEYDFSGKTIIPFASHEGSGLGNGPSEISEICPEAQIMDGFAARGTEVRSSKADIEKWIESLNLDTK